MMPHKVLLPLVISTLISCNSRNSTNDITTKADRILNHQNGLPTTDTELQTDAKVQYAIITNVFLDSNTTIIEADYIQFLTGNAAIDAAKKANEADTFLKKDGTIEYVVPNDYFIVNENKKIRQLPLAKNCLFDLLQNTDRIPSITDNSLKSFEMIFDKNPFILTFDDKGFVVKIQEVFVP